MPAFLKQQVVIDMTSILPSLTSLLRNVSELVFGNTLAAELVAPEFQYQNPSAIFDAFLEVGVLLYAF